MDIVILAGGENTRLKGIVAPHHKPLLVINGESLIVRLVRQALLLKPGKIVIVVSPRNADPILELLMHNFTDISMIYFVMQTPGTTIDVALRSGLMMTGSTEKVMVLCGDNFMTDEDWKDLIHAPQIENRSVIVGQCVTSEDVALNFARVWPIYMTLTEATVEMDKQKFSDGRWYVWNGPIIVNGPRTLMELEEKRTGRIAACLILDEPYFYEMNVQDIGTPQALERRA